MAESEDLFAAAMSQRGQQETAREAARTDWSRPCPPDPGLDAVAHSLLRAVPERTAQPIYSRMPGSRIEMVRRGLFGKEPRSVRVAGQVQAHGWAVATGPSLTLRPEGFSHGTVDGRVMLAVTVEAQMLIVVACPPAYDRETGAFLTTDTDALEHSVTAKTDELLIRKGLRRDDERELVLGPLTGPSAPASLAKRLRLQAAATPEWLAERLAAEATRLGATPS